MTKRNKIILLLSIIFSIVGWSTISLCDYPLSLLPASVAVISNFAFLMVVVGPIWSYFTDRKN